MIEVHSRDPCRDTAAQMDRFFALTLLLLLLQSVSVTCSARKKDGGLQVDQAVAKLSRSRRSYDGNKLCPCPGLHGLHRQNHHQHRCPCDGLKLYLPEHSRHHRYRHGRSSRHLNSRRQECQKFLKFCQDPMRGLQIPL